MGTTESDKRHYFVEIVLSRTGFVDAGSEHALHQAYLLLPLAVCPAGFIGRNKSQEAVPRALHWDHLTSTVTSTETPWHPDKSSSLFDVTFSGLGSTERVRMLIEFFLIAQVSDQHLVSSTRDNDVTLMVLPSPQCCVAILQDCFNVVCLMLLTFGDVEQNPGPDSDSDECSQRELMKRILREQKETNKTLKQLSSNIKHVETIVADLQERMTVIENERRLWKECEDKIVHCEESCKSTMTQVEFLASKVDDLENRSRRNNLVIYGLRESSAEDVKTLEEEVRDSLFRKILGIEVNSIERLHKIGTKQSQRTRPVIIRLFNFAEKNKILSSCF
ncbi:uncharacterized protein [Dermacentor albipictus]|uniref:uncharacterized protein n=1 Tax=Dermacentor albipictus TaxID=60249 RepID=UPI0038FC0CCD